VAGKREASTPRANYGHSLLRSATRQAPSKCWMQHLPAIRLTKSALGILTWLFAPRTIRASGWLADYELFAKVIEIRRARAKRYEGVSTPT